MLKGHSPDRFPDFNTIATWNSHIRSVTMKLPSLNVDLLSKIPFLLLYSLTSRFVSADQSFTPNIHPTLAVSRIATPIKIDGKLDDPAWRNAALASNFSEYNPNDMVKPPVKTDVLAAYDDANFYLGFIAYDNPAQLRVSMRQRDEAWQDDDVGIILDTYGDGSWAYEIFCNPIGIQGDVRWSNGNEDISFDLVFQTAGIVTDSGYQVEFAIPFKSLRFPNKPSQTWRATFWRNHPRTVRGQYTWAAIDKDAPCFPCEFGTLTGIENVKPGRDIALLPAVTGYQSAAIRDDSDPNSGLKYDSPEGRLSLGARYSLSSSSTIEGTWKPDFSQVESDVAQIDVNSNFALFYNEHRPFFQEGYDLFDTPFTVVYTRSINDPLFAAKIVTRTTRTSIAYLGGRDQHSPIILPFEEWGTALLAGKSTTNIVRAKQTFGQDSYIGGILTTRIFDKGGSGSLGGIDGRLRLSKRYSITYQALLSRTLELTDSALSAELEQPLFDNARHTTALDGEAYWGQAFYAALYRDAKSWNFNIQYRDKSPTFRADNGFVEGNDHRSIEGWNSINLYPERDWLNLLSLNADLASAYNYSGVRKDSWVMPEVVVQTIGQTRLEVGYLWDRERFKNIVFGDYHRATINLSSNFSDPVNLSFNGAFGRFIARNLDVPVLGRGYNYSVSATVKPWSRFVIEPEYDYSSLNYPEGDSTIFRGYVLRIKFNYQFNRELMARSIVQYDDFSRDLSFEPLLSYQLNPFTIFYIGSSYGYEKYVGVDGMTPISEQYFMKLQYLVGI
jgi:hypothetical protein